MCGEIAGEMASPAAGQVAGRVLDPSPECGSLRMGTILLGFRGKAKRLLAERPPEAVK